MHVSIVKSNKIHSCFYCKILPPTRGWPWPDLGLAHYDPTQRASWGQGQGQHLSDRPWPGRVQGQTKSVLTWPDLTFEDTTDDARHRSKRRRLILRSVATLILN